MNNLRKVYFFCLLNCVWTPCLFSQKWDSVPGPFPGTNAIRSMYADSTYLYVAGAFNKLQGIHTQGIARWNGIRWDSMGAGIDRLIRYDTGNYYPENTFAFAEYHHKLYVGGVFWSAGYLISQGIGIWNDTAWDTIPVRPFKESYIATSQDVFALAVINNKLYVGGDFDTVAGKPCIGIACWNDTNWSSLNFPNLSLFSEIDAICEYKSSIYVGGLFDGTCNGTVENMLRWDSAGWHSMGIIRGSLADVWCMVVYNGELYVGGEFYKSDGNVGNNIEKWDGAQWSEVSGGTDHRVENMIIYKGKLYAMGVFTEAGGVPADGIAEWDGIKWCSFSGKINNDGISSSCIYKDSLYIGGGFAILSKDTISDLAEWVDGDYTDSCEITTGIKEVMAKGEEINVYPNPTVQNVTMQLNLPETEQVNITLFNLLGEIVYSESVEGQQGVFQKQVSLASLANATYILKAETKDQIYYSKIAKLQ